MKTMKNMPMRLIGALALVLMVAFNSCKEDEGVITPQFPELKEVTCKVGETIDITFNANLDWSIESDAAWCKFINGEFTETNATGKAGEQTLKIQISDESWNYDTDDVAKLTLKMMDAQQVIYEITRAKREYLDLVITDDSGNKYDANNPLTIKGSGLRDVTADSVFTIVTATADMQVGITKKPDWLYVKNMGNGVFSFIFDKGKQATHGKNPIYSFKGGENDKIVFATKDYIDGNVETDKVRMVEVPVNYEGLKANYVEFKDNYEGDRYPSDLYATIDGTKFVSKKTNIETGEVEVGEEFASPLKTSVTVRDYKYHVVTLDLKKEKAPNQFPYNVISVNEDGSNLDWITTTVKDKDIELTVTELTSENRGAIVLVFSEDLWQSILTDSVSKYGTLKDALVYKESIWKPGKDSQESEIFGDNIRGEYAGNVWTNLFQEKENESDNVSFTGFLLDSWNSLMTFDDIQFNLGPDYASITPFTEDLGLGTDNVYIVDMKNELLTYGTIYIEVINYSEGMTLEFGTPIEKVQISEDEYDGKKCIRITGENENDANSIITVKSGDTVVAACAIQFHN